MIPEIQLRREEWMTDATCATMGPDQWDTLTPAEGICIKCGRYRIPLDPDGLCVTCEAAQPFGKTEQLKANQ